MARWKLTKAHYLNIEGTVWEYQETERATGKPKRYQFPVPTLLDPDDPSNWNYKTYGPNGMLAEGQVIVAWDTGKQQAQDYIFKGQPTPEMEPLDAEAEEASAKFAEAWKRPPEAEGTSFGDALIQQFQAKFDKIGSPQGATAIEGMSELLAAMTQMMKQNQEMMMMIMGKQLGLAPTVDAEPPLEDAEPTEEEIAASAAAVRADPVEPPPVRRRA